MLIFIKISATSVRRRAKVFWHTFESQNASLLKMTLFLFSTKKPQQIQIIFQFLKTQLGHRILSAKTLANLSNFHFPNKHETEIETLVNSNIFLPIAASIFFILPHQEVPTVLQPRKSRTLHGTASYGLVKLSVSFSGEFLSKHNDFQTDKR